jgi:hypothetical protein
VSETVVDAVWLPEVPVMVTVTVEARTEAPAVSVSTLDPVVLLGENAAVIPLGRPDAVSATLPVNPFKSFTNIVSVALPPSATEVVDAEDDSVKLGVALLPLQVVPLIAKFVGIALVTPFQVPLNPMLE